MVTAGALRSEVESAVDRAEGDLGQRNGGDDSGVGICLRVGLGICVGGEAERGIGGGEREGDLRGGGGGGGFIGCRR